MQTKILGLSGKKQSGKNTSANYILGLFMKRLAIIDDEFTITEKGELHVSDLFGDKQFAGIFDINVQTDDMKLFKKEHLDHFIKIYSLADMLKTDICINVLGLEYNQCFGTDKEKNSYTKLRWDDMPGRRYGHEAKVGCMTGRDVMQFIGTEVFRKIYNDVWIDATIRKIINDNAAIAIITDVRFPNEVNRINKVGGKVCRFMRSPFSDKHLSETALDSDNFDWKKFAHIIDNRSRSIKYQNDNMLLYLNEIQWVPKDIKTY